MATLKYKLNAVYILLYIYTDFNHAVLAEIMIAGTGLWVYYIFISQQNSDIMLWLLNQQRFIMEYYQSNQTKCTFYKSTSKYLPNE